MNNLRHLEGFIEMNFGKIDNILLLGGGKGLYNCCLVLKELGLQPTVITSPRHAEARVHDATFPELLAKKNIPLLITETLNTKAVSDLIDDRTLALSFGAAWIFASDFIDRFRGRLLNVHGARLPKDRGAGGFSWRILRGDYNGACCIHRVDTGIDSGEIIMYQEFVYPQSCRKPLDFYNYTLEMYLPFLEDFLHKVLAGENFHPARQEEAISTYYPRLNTAIQGVIDWSWGLAEIERLICAFDDPYQGASTYYHEMLVHLKDCFITLDDGAFHPFMSGQVYRKHDGVIYIATRDGGLAVREITDASGIDIYPKIRLGHRFHTPSTELVRAVLFNPVYKAS